MKVIVQAEVTPFRKIYLFKDWRRRFLEDEAKNQNFASP